MVKFGPKDSVARYEVEIDYLVRKCYPTADDSTWDVVGLRHFIRGLFDNTMKRAVLIKEPKNMAEARSHMEVYLSVEDTIKPRGIRTVTVHDDSVSDMPCDNSNQLQHVDHVKENFDLSATV